MMVACSLSAIDVEPAVAGFGIATVASSLSVSVGMGTVKSEIAGVGIVCPGAAEPAGAGLGELGAVVVACLRAAS